MRTLWCLWWVCGHQSSVTVLVISHIQDAAQKPKGQPDTCDVWKGGDDPSRDRRRRAAGVLLHIGSVYCTQQHTEFCNSYFIRVYIDTVPSFSFSIMWCPWFQCVKSVKLREAKDFAPLNPSLKPEITISNLLKEQVDPKNQGGKWWERS